MNVDQIITLVVLGGTIIIWLVRLEGKIAVASTLAIKNEEKIGRVMQDVNELETDSAVIRTTLVSMEQEVKAIKNFITDGGFARLKVELVNEIKEIVNG